MKSPVVLFTSKIGAILLWDFSGVLLRWFLHHRKGGSWKIFQSFSQNVLVEKVPTTQLFRLCEHIYVNKFKLDIKNYVNIFLTWYIYLSFDVLIQADNQISITQD